MGIGWWSKSVDDGFWLGENGYEVDTSSMDNGKGTFSGGVTWDGTFSL
jgi:hypothetical protein